MLYVYPQVGTGKTINGRKIVHMFSRGGHCSWKVNGST